MEAAKDHAFRMYGLAGQTAVVTGGTKVVQDAVQLTAVHWSPASLAQGSQA
jgi:hypothetical protein